MWSYVNNSAATGSKVTSGSTATVTPGIALSAGVRIVIFIEVHDSVSNSVSSVTDTLGNSYVQDKTTNFGAGLVYGAIYSATNKTLGKPVITANFTALTSGAAVMATSAYNGVDASTVDTSSSITGTAANASTTTPATTGYNELVVGAYFDDGNADANLSQGADFTRRAVFSNDANVEIVLQDKNSFNLVAQTSKVVSAAGNWGMLCVVYKLSSGLPTRASDELDIDTNKNVMNVAVDDGDYFIQYGSEYLIQEYKKDWTNNTDTPTFVWKGRTTQSTLVSPFFVQIYNVSTSAWETLARETRIPADTDFTLTVSQASNVANYYDTNNIVAFRTYQLVI